MGQWQFALLAEISSLFRCSHEIFIENIILILEAHLSIWKDSTSTISRNYLQNNVDSFYECYRSQMGCSRTKKNDVEIYKDVCSN